MKYSGISGFAVLEGVCIRNKNDVSMAIRRPDGKVELNKSEYKGANEDGFLFKIPFFRGIATFFDSGSLFFSYFCKSIDVNDKYAKKGKKSSIDLFFTILFMILGVGLCIYLPMLFSDIVKIFVLSIPRLYVSEFFFRLLMMVIYFIIVTHFKAIKRLFMYFGAQNKVINCVNKGHKLNVKNAMKMSRDSYLNKIGFTFAVLIISLPLFTFVSYNIMWIRILIRLGLLIFVAGVYYEILLVAANKKNKFFRLLAKPVLMIERLINAEPSEKMVELTIEALEDAYDWQAFYEKKQRMIARRRRVEALRKKAREEEEKILAGLEDSEVSEVTAEDDDNSSSTPIAPVTFDMDDDFESDSSVADKAKVPEKHAEETVAPVTTQPLEALDAEKDAPLVKEETGTEETGNTSKKAKKKAKKAGKEVKVIDSADSKPSTEDVSSTPDKTDVKEEILSKNTADLSKVIDEVKATEKAPAVAPFDEEPSKKESKKDKNKKKSKKNKVKEETPDTSDESIKSGDSEPDFKEVIPEKLKNKVESKASFVSDSDEVSSEKVSTEKVSNETDSSDESESIFSDKRNVFHAEIDPASLSKKSDSKKKPKRKKRKFGRDVEAEKRREEMRRRNEEERERRRREREQFNEKYGGINEIEEWLKNLDEDDDNDN